MVRAANAHTHVHACAHGRKMVCSGDVARNPDLSEYWRSEAGQSTIKLVAASVELGTHLTTVGAALSACARLAGATL